VPQANAEALRIARQVVVPNLRYRTDIGDRVARSDLARLQALGWFDAVDTQQLRPRVTAEVA